MRSSYITPICDNEQNQLNQDWTCFIAKEVEEKKQQYSTCVQKWENFIVF